MGARQFQRIYAPCGAYTEQPILKNGEIMCPGCHRPINSYDLVDDGHYQVCVFCLKEGTIKRCQQCQSFVLPRLTFGRRFDDMRFKTDDLCDACQPPISFTFNVRRVSTDLPTKVTVNVPKKCEMGLSFNYFYHELAKQLKIDPSHISIENYGLYQVNNELMMCPAEYIKDTSRIFDVIITSNK